MIRKILSFSGIRSAKARPVNQTIAKRIRKAKFWRGVAAIVGLVSLPIIYKSVDITLTSSMHLFKESSGEGCTISGLGWSFVTGSGNKQVMESFLANYDVTFISPGTAFTVGLVSAGIGIISFMFSLGSYVELSKSIKNLIRHK
jgi:hypothetical protein